MSREHTSVCDIVSLDYEAMYAYKCGLYEQCFRLSRESVDRLLYTKSSRITNVLNVRKSDLLSLTDDDCLSLIGLAKLCGVFDINPLGGEHLNQLTLSMYLLVQSKLRLQHSMTSLVAILPAIQSVHDIHNEIMFINRAMMTFVYRKIVLRLKSHQC